jgi:hypothetical protein
MPARQINRLRLEEFRARLRRDACSGADLPTPPPVDPAKFPEVDVLYVDRVISGKYNLRNSFMNPALFASDDEMSEPCPVGTGPCPENCRDINLWGLSEEVTEEELLSLCREFGAVANVQLVKPKADGDLGCATVTFEERLSAQKAQSSLHRECLHGKVC